MLLVVWNALFFHDQPFTATAGKSEAWNRGAWLVQGPGHCAACHTPKNVLGGDKRDAALQGYALQGWVAPDITRNVARGLALWSSDDMIAFLRGGHNATSAAGGPMKEVVEDSTSQLSDADLQAMTSYLASFASNATLPVAVPTTDPAMQAGAAIFSDLCSACHTQRGSGVPYTIPDLAVSPAVSAHDSDGVVHVLLFGAQSAATQAEPTGPAMPSYGDFLTDEQIAAIATYVRNSWGHAAKATSASEIQKARKHPEG
jgi:mono/diheme cytochrome c family protein